MSEADLSNIDLIVKHRVLIAELLELAANQFANHGCNEFDLTDCLPDRIDQHKLAKTMFDEDDPDEYNPETDYSVMHDWRLMVFCGQNTEVNNRCLTVPPKNENKNHEQ